MDIETKAGLIFELKTVIRSLLLCSNYLFVAGEFDKSKEADGAATVTEDWLKHIEAEAVD